MLQQIDYILNFVSLYQKILRFCENCETNGKIMETFVFALEEEMLVMLFYFYEIYLLVNSFHHNQFGETVLCRGVFDSSIIAED